MEGREKTTAAIAPEKTGDGDRLADTFPLSHSLSLPGGPFPSFPGSHHPHSILSSEAPLSVSLSSRKPALIAPSRVNYSFPKEV